MKEDFLLLKKEFIRIKNMGLITPLRKGSTGIGYTFETLLNKKEDQECKPDFNGIELKTKFDYSKSPMTLFHCAPKRHNNSAIQYIFDNYSYLKKSNKNILMFEHKIYSNQNTKKYNYHFKLKIDYYGKEIIMKSFYKDTFLENVCYWDFKTLEYKLKTKLKRLAIIHAYPYRKNGKLYYKYAKINIYKLKGFFEFLKLINEDKIHVQFYLKNNVNDNKNTPIENHGIAFRIDINYIEELFSKFYY